MNLLARLRRAWRGHDERLAEDAAGETPAFDPGAAAEGEYDAMRAGGLMGPRSDELDIEPGERD